MKRHSNDPGDDEQFVSLAALVAIVVQVLVVQFEETLLPLPAPRLFAQLPTQRLAEAKPYQGVRRRTFSGEAATP